jgi:hypothetical protein
MYLDIKIKWRTSSGEHLAMQPMKGWARMAARTSGEGDVA